MARLIDADALKERFDECPYNWTDSPEEIQAVLDWDITMDNIDATPTVDAIPVEWLKHRLTMALKNGCDAPEQAIRYVLWLWEQQKDGEQEAQDG